MSNPCPHDWQRLRVADGGWSAAGRIDLKCDCGAYLYFDIADAHFISDPTLTLQMPNPSPIAELQASWDKRHLSEEHFKANARRYYRRTKVRP